MQADLKPVMVFIHGGAFTSGSNSKQMYNPDFLIREDVVVVTINYRLGLLGEKYFWIIPKNIKIDFESLREERLYIYISIDLLRTIIRFSD